jgi:hypothetical protein
MDRSVKIAALILAGSIGFYLILYLPWKDRQYENSRNKCIESAREVARPILGKSNESLTKTEIQAVTEFLDKNEETCFRRYPPR